MKNIRQKIHNYLNGLMIKKADNDDTVDTDIEMDTSVVKNTEKITSDSVARQLTENLDEKVDIEEEMDFDGLNITGN